MTAPNLQAYPTSISTTASATVVYAEAGSGSFAAKPIYYPAAPAAGDIAFMFAFCSGIGANLVSTPTFAEPSGFTACGDLVGKVDSASGGDCYARLFWRRCDGNEAESFNYAFDSDTAAQQVRAGAIVLVRGAKSSGTPFEDYQVASGSATTATSPSTTVTGTERLGLRFLLLADNSTIGASSGSWAEAYNVVTPTGDDAAFSLDYLQLDANEGASTRSVAAADAWVFFSLAVLPDGVSVVSKLALLGVG